MALYSENGLPDAGAGDDIRRKNRDDATCRVRPGATDPLTLACRIGEFQDNGIIVFDGPIAFFRFVFGCFGEGPFFVAFPQSADQKFDRAKVF